MFGFLNKEVVEQCHEAAMFQLERKRGRSVQVENFNFAHVGDSEFWQLGVSPCGTYSEWWAHLSCAYDVL